MRHMKNLRRDETGFTLVEILVSLAIFAMVAIGAIGVLGATDSGGFMEGFPTGFMTARVAKDYTASSVYLQAFNEFVAAKGTANATPGTYCVGSACSPVVSLPSGLAGYPTPPNAGYQLDWTRLDVLIQRWHWDETADVDGVGSDKGKTYCVIGTAGCSSVSTNEYVTLTRSTLTWRIKGASRSMTVERYIP